MKVLTLTQPWATLVAIGAKKIETRSWQTSYRGPLAIHAAKGFPREAIELCFEEPFARALLQAGISVPNDLPRGVIISICELMNIYPTTELDSDVFSTQGLLTPDGLLAVERPEIYFGDFSEGRFGWMLENARRLYTPIPAKGALGLWEYSGDGLICQETGGMKRCAPASARRR